MKLKKNAKEELIDDCNQKMPFMDILSTFIGEGNEQYGHRDEDHGNIMFFAPSEYKIQFLLSIEDRLTALGTIKSHFFYPRELDVTPAIVIFQHCIPKKKYCTTIRIRNTDTVRNI